MSEFDIKAPIGANKNKKVLGRGSGTGLGKTSGKGNKGQKARSGGGVRPGFEGGQTPLFRRVPRRGFSNSMFKTEYTVINLDQLEKAYENGETVNHLTLKEKGLVKSSENTLKILARGEISKKLNFEGLFLSGKAQEKIEKAGGKVTVLDTENSK